MIDKDDWQEALSTNQADGNSASSFLEEMINENLEENITTDEIIENLKEHYTYERN